MCSDSTLAAKVFMFIFLSPATSLSQLASRFTSSHFCTKCCFRFSPVYSSAILSRTLSGTPIWNTSCLVSSTVSWLIALHTSNVDILLGAVIPETFTVLAHLNPDPPVRSPLKTHPRVLSPIPRHQSSRSPMPGAIAVGRRMR